MKKQPQMFGDWSEAFDYCREANCPMTVEIVTPAEEPGVWKLFPSGAARLIRNTQTNDDRNDR